jgi:hypothetical protein
MKTCGGIAALVAISALLGGCAATRPGSEVAAVDGATQAVAQYATALAASDADALVRMTHPALVVRAGGIDSFRVLQVELLNHLKENGWPASGREQRGIPSNPYIDGNTLMVGIPAVRKISGMADAGFVYVAISYDGGKSWSVLVLSCTDEHWLKGMAPNYRGSPDILGQDNPAYTTFEKTGTIDEAMFLKGTHWRN